MRFKYWASKCSLGVGNWWIKWVQDRIYLGLFILRFEHSIWGWEWDVVRICIRWFAIFYGTDIERLKNIWSIPKSTQTVFILLVLFMNCAAIVLYIVRRRMKLRGAGVAAAFIDTMVAFTAGGNLRMHHKLERWFFGILLIAAFFIITIFMGDLLDSIYQILHKVDTFDQLSKIESPIYIHPVFGDQSVLICEMLRFDENWTFCIWVFVYWIWTLHF